MNVLESFNNFKNNLNFCLFYSKVLIDLIIISLNYVFIELLKIIRKYMNVLNVSFIFKSLCLVSLIYCSFLVTFDYFSYPYVFKLNVNNNINGFDLPPISFCTETKVLFNKNKFIEKFNESEIFRNYRIREFQEFELLHKSTMEKRSGSLLYDTNYWYPIETFDERKEFFKDLSFDELSALMIRANQMINCSAKLHSRYHSNEIQTQDCVQDFNVLQSIYGNKDFGICYTFFDSNEKFYLKDDDYIQFEFNYEKGPAFIFNSFFEADLVLREEFKRIDFDSVIYYLVHQKSKYFKPIKQNSVKLSRQGLEGELKLTKTSINLISAPYMDQCYNNQGM